MTGWTLTRLGWSAAAALAFLVTAFLLAIAGSPASLWAEMGAGEGVNAVAGARRSLVYRLRAAPAPETVFTFSSPRREFRILSSAALGAGAALQDGGWRYGYRVTGRSAGGGTVFVRDVYSMAILPEQTSEEEGTRYLRTSTDRITLQNAVVFDAPAPVSTVALAPLAGDPAVRGVDARVYERQPLARSAALNAYFRRDTSERARLARGSAFPPSALSDAERVAVIRNSWRPVGPNGIASEDYAVAMMYETDPVDDSGEGGPRP